jgi:hypothetical protein
MGFPVWTGERDARDSDSALADQVGRVLQLQQRPAPIERFGSIDFPLTTSHEAALQRARVFQDQAGDMQR